MPRTLSPLRYPGGKTAIFPIVSEIIRAKGLKDVVYLEPFAGGAGLALSLLLNNFTDEIYLNDIDRSISSFWKSILSEKDRFIEKIECTPITVEEWHRQRAVQFRKETAGEFELGFSTFYLNRTNRSGIIFNAGLIGGYRQSGQYRLDCRFHKDNLIKKIQTIAEFRDQIHIYNLDAVEFIGRLNNDLSDNTLYYIDPPYYSKGHTLYTDYYNRDDHEILSKVILELDKHWILTYDDTSPIRDLYRTQFQFKFNLNYSLARKRVGSELLILSNSIAELVEQESLTLALQFSLTQVIPSQFPESTLISQHF